MTITQSELRAVLDYDADTGEFHWKVKRNGVKPGVPAGTLHAKGYRAIKVGGKLHRAHRLAFLWMAGRMPTDQVDHRDGDKDNNRFANLREATNGQNQHNQTKRANNSSGYKGVYYFKRDARWQAQIMVNRKKHHLGYFDTPEEAHAAHVRAAIQLHGEFANVEMAA